MRRPPFLAMIVPCPAFSTGHALDEGHVVALEEDLAWMVSIGMLCVAGTYRVVSVFLCRWSW